MYAKVYNGSCMFIESLDNTALYNKSCGGANYSTQTARVIQ
jgi:hypothetical protein